jgi:pyruvate kinase
MVCLRVVGHRGEKVELEVETGGYVSSKKGVNIPDMELKKNIITAKDEEDIAFGIENKVDYIAQSFVRNKQDILRVVNMVKPGLPDCKFIAKIENRDGVENIESITDACDGIMIARGDLGVSLPIYQIPFIQKDIIHLCSKKKQFVITATQMLESMTEHPRPTRAEVSDVANAILDGSDFLMLSGETAVGNYPVESVEMMCQIIEFTKK